jgi:hypothetical protein
MVRLVSGNSGSLPPVVGPGIGGGSEPEQTGLDRPGTFGVDLLGGSAGLLGGGVSATLGTLGEVVNTPFEIVSGEIAEKRLGQQLTGLDLGISQRYIDMVRVNGMSISDVADQMANESAGITNDAATELLLAVFMDPFNLIAAGAGKGYDVAKKSASIQERINQTTVDGIASSAVRYGASAEEEAWLKGNSGKELLGRMYSKTAKGLGGIKRGMATAMLGRGSGVAAAIIGVRFLFTAIEVAKRSKVSDQLIDAVAVGTNHVTMGAAADVVTNRVFGQSRASALRKAQIVAKSSGVDDTVAFDKYVRVNSGSSETAGDSLEYITAEWKQLHLVAKSAGLKAETAVYREILNQNVAGEINEQIGKTGVLSILKAERTIDEVAIARRVEDQKTVAVDEAMFLLSGASDDAGRIALAKEEFLSNLSPIVGDSVAAEIWEESLRLAAKSSGSNVRQLGELIYASEVMRLGYVAKQFGAAKKSLLSRINTTAVRSRLSDITRPMVEQAERWTIVAKDTMTDKDYATTVRILADDTLSTAERAKAALYAVRRFSILRNQYDAKGFARLATGDEASQKKAVDALQDTLSQYEEGSFLKEVPIDEFKGADEVLPELGAMRNSAERGEYRLAFEPETAAKIATIPNRVYQNAVTKDVSRFGVDLWVPITDDAIDVTLGNRNFLGSALDTLTRERRTTAVVANTLTRMQEYVIQKNLPISRAMVRKLHSRLTDRAFEMKGSIRTAFTEANQGSNTSTTIIDELILDAKKLSQTDYETLLAMKTSGELRRMIFLAAEGDASVVGLTSKLTGRIKTEITANFVTSIPDMIYPSVKFTLSPIFGLQEVIESKYWNTIRGYGSEMSLGQILRKRGIESSMADDIRFGTKRFYDIEDPATGKIVKVDSVDVLAELYISERSELKFAQEMNSINMYYAGSVTDAILSPFGANSESFVKGLAESLGGAQNVGRYKANDWYKYVTSESLDEIADGLGARFAEHAPMQWATWLKLAGGDRRGAALIMMRERQALIRGRQSARSYLDANKPMGMGFGRQYDDAPIKNLDITVRELSKKVKSKDPAVRRAALDDLDKRLGAIHAEAAIIGYSVEGLDALTRAKGAIETARTAARLTVKNNLTKKSTTTADAVVSSLDDARGALRSEFETAVARKGLVRDALIADGISKPLANEMAALFVVAEKRRELVPQISIAITKAMKGERLSPEILDTLKDSLIHIRGARAPEETMWNAIIHSIDGAAARADKTHFFNPGRSFLERSLNHPVFALYPVSYMFGKVLPEYSRMLYLSPTRGVSGMVLAPWMAILRAFGGSKFSAENWGKYAPLVGFNAASDIRQAMVENLGEDATATKNPLIYMLANTLIPGLPSEVGTSLSRPVRVIGEEFTSGERPNFGTIGRAVSDQAVGIVGLGRAAQEAGKILDYALFKEDSLLAQAGDAIGDAAESLRDIIRPK